MASSIIYALLGGIIPALLWLLFWLREDNKKPEPQGVILRTFLLGMLAVVLVLPFQKLVSDAFPTVGLMTFIVWAALEEFFKFAAAYFGGLRTIDDDEPIDAVIYMITAALGFVALENSLFILRALIEHGGLTGIIAGNMRFIGASLLHIISSSVIGVALAFSFYQARKYKIKHAVWGFILAVIIHTIFNVVIYTQTGYSTFFTFATVWLAATLLILFFEKIKMLQR